MAEEPQDPQQPPQYRLEDILNIGDVQQQLSAIFLQAFRDAEQQGKQTFQNIIETAKNIKKVFNDIEFSGISDEAINALKRVTSVAEKEKKEEAKIRQDFDKKILTVERQKYNELVKEQQKLLSGIKGVHVQELNEVRGSIKDKEKLRQAEIDLIKKQELELAQFKVKTQKEISQAALSARASEGDPLAKMQQGWNSIVDKAKEYSKSLTNVESLWGAVILLLMDASRQTADITKSQAALRSAGLAGTGNVLLRGSLGGMMSDGGELNEIAAGAMGNLSDQLNLTAQDVAALIQELAGAPHALEEVRATGGKTLDTFVAGMGRMGITAEESIDIIEDTSNTFGLSIANLNKIMNTAENVTKETGINFRQVFQSMIRLTGQMRMLTFNSDAATNVLLGTVKPLQDLKFSNVEIQNFNDAIGNLLGQLSPSKLAGMVAFTTGQAPTGVSGRKQLLDAADKPLETLVDFFKPVLDNFEAGSAERLYATQKLAEQMGLGAATTVKGSQAFEKIVDEFGQNPAKMKEAFDKFKQSDEFKTPEQLQADGFKSLIGMRTPIENLHKSVVAFVNRISDPAYELFTTLNSMIPALRMTLSPLSGISKLTGWGQTTTSMDSPWTPDQIKAMAAQMTNQTTQLGVRSDGGRGSGKKG